MLPCSPYCPPPCLFPSFSACASPTIFDNASTKSSGAGVRSEEVDSWSAGVGGGAAGVLTPDGGAVCGWKERDARHLLAVNQTMTGVFRTLRRL